MSGDSMTNYTMLTQPLLAMVNAQAGTIFAQKVVPDLISIWLKDYGRGTVSAKIIETSLGDYSYLFDITFERLIAAWSISQGPHHGPRDRTRMAGHPQNAGAAYHRGHAIPHSMGGPMDINLVPQLGSVNIGAFRELERRAVATPGSLYFTYWIYAQPLTQTPNGVDQGLLISGRLPEIRTHRN
jgi:hypothetical protein